MFVNPLPIAAMTFGDRFTSLLIYLPIAARIIASGRLSCKSFASGLDRT
ncbi:MAG: hypothetical protein ABSD52_14615 [Candidatus Cybelea sp.]